MHVDPQKTARFWAAVSDVSDSDLAETYQAALQGQPSHWFSRCSALLHAAHPDLVFTVEVPQPDAAVGGPRSTIEVSGDGLRHAIRAVLAVVDAAPPAVTSRFDVRAFRSRSLDVTGLQMRVGGTSLGVENVTWTADPDRSEPTACHLTVYVPGWIETLPADSAVNQGRLQAVFLLLDHTVGEFAVMTQIHHLELRSPTSAPSQSRPLADLADHLDRLAAS